MARSVLPDLPPESDRFSSAPHPREAATLIGHGLQERMLLDAYRSEKLPQAWIIGGREGVGKATLAWRFARFLFVNPDPRVSAVRAATHLETAANHPAARRLSAMSHGDLALLRREWNDRSKRHFTEIRIDDVRRALGLFRRASGEGGWRVCLIDSAEDLNRSSANALLKLVEEPPPRSLFLLIAHRPAQVMATLRSRSRMLLLDPLTPDQVAEAVRAVGPPWSQKPGEEVARAAGLSGGSVREALRLLDGGSLKLIGLLERLLADLPRLDWRAAQSVADQVSRREADDLFRTFLAACYGWLDGRARRGGPPSQLAPLAAAWERIAGAARDVEALNLDRKPFVLGVFADLAQAAEAARMGSSRGALL